MEWTQRWVGDWGLNFFYNFTLATSVKVHLYVNGFEVGQPVLLDVGNVAVGSTASSTASSSSSSNQAVLALINSSSELPAGSEVLLQLNTSMVSFANLTNAGTGWGLTMQQPDGTQSYLGYMQASSTAVVGAPPSTVYSWMPLTTIRLTQVGQLTTHRSS
jgi:hypothetical protein